MLLRLAVLHNVPIACNRSSADFLISSPLFFNQNYFAERMAAVVRRNRRRPTRASTSESLRG
jgi:methylglyoxal synthase